MDYVQGQDGQGVMAAYDSNVLDEKKTLKNQGMGKREEVDAAGLGRAALFERGGLGVEAERGMRADYEIGLESDTKMGQGGEGEMGIKQGMEIWQGSESESESETGVKRGMEMGRGAEQEVEVEQGEEMVGGASGVIELGKVVDLELPPGMEMESGSEEIASQVMGFDEGAIKTGDKLAKAGVAQVDKLRTELNRTGEVAEFYEAAREMMERNLENSYNRKLGQ